MTSFADLGVRPRTLQTLEQARITSPLPVQEEAIPVLLTGRDRGPELWAVFAALPRDEAIRRAA